MADEPEDEDRETIVQRVVKLGLIAIPIIWYVSWAHKKFVPCPKVSYHQANSPECTVQKTSKKLKCQRPKQELVDECKKTRQRSDKREPSRYEYIRYFKRSATQYCEKIRNVGKSCKNNKTEEKQQQIEKKSNCGTQQKTEPKPAANTCPQLNSEAISPEAFDELFEQHFQKCVDEFKEHKLRVEEEIKRLREECERKEPNVEKLSDEERGKYLQSLADFNLDKDFECDQSFYSKNSDTPYVVKDYKCQTSREGEHKTETNENSYLQCLTDLNMDKNFEDAETNTYLERDCCPKRRQEEPVKCNNSCSQTKQESIRKTIKEDPCKWKTQEELCEDEIARGRRSQQNDGGVSNIYTKAKLDDCGCDPHSNTIDTKYETSKGDPCAHRSMEEEADDNALKNFWHACGPPKGLRTGCRARGCENSTNKH